MVYSDQNWNDIGDLLSTSMLFLASYDGATFDILQLFSGRA